MALKRLRNYSLERIIWIDAICINQYDTEERNRQVQQMAEIYAKASRVIVWLEEATVDDGQEVHTGTTISSARALNDLCVAAGDQPMKSLLEEMSQQAIQCLLRRSWFQRIWVLQEVAAARHVTISCHSTEIDGYAFCSGLNALNLASPELDLQSRVRSAAYLIKGAIFRPRIAISRLNRFSLDIRTLGELVDMYHDRDATDRRDKVFALLGMSSDDYIPADLSPDYNISWKTLFHRFVKFLLGKQASVKTWEDKEIAVIKSMGCVLGEIASVKSAGDWDDRQTLEIKTHGYPGRTKGWIGRWTLHATAKYIQKGDIVCLLQGTSKPTIVRLYSDYSTIVAIAATPTKNFAGARRLGVPGIDWPSFLRSTTVFPRDFLLIWDWEESRGRLGDGEDHESLISQARNHAESELQGSLDKGARLRDMGLILGDLEKYEEAVKNLLKIISAHEGAARKELQQTLATMDNLASMCEGGGDSKEAEKLRAMANLLGRRGEYAAITQDGMIHIATSFGHEMMKFLFDWRENEVQITGEVVKAVAGDATYGKEVMALLLDRHAAEIRITEEVVKAAAGNWRCGEGMMRLLLDRRSAEIIITEEVVEAVAGNYGSIVEIMALLLDRCGDRIMVTPRLVEIFAKSFDSSAIERLLDHRGTEIRYIYI